MTIKKRYALIGVAGYVAPKHMKAIHATGGELVAGLDISDSVGILDKYFPNCSFFTKFGRFERYIDKLARSGNGIDYLVVCTPNHLHDTHIRYGLRIGANVICEKPLVINPWNLTALLESEVQADLKIYTILQLREHAAVKELRQRVMANRDKRFNLTLTYLTARGLWYFSSWKGDKSKSGGISTNIGIHFFDMLTWIFGDVVSSEVHVHTHDRAGGFLELEKADVKWFLSINADIFPESTHHNGMMERSLTIDNEKIDFTRGFDDLHTKSYQSILVGRGNTIHDAKSSIQLAYDIRNAQPILNKNRCHELSLKKIDIHPFKKI